MKRIVIIGAGGHGRVVADIAGTFYDEVLFLDDNPSVPGTAGTLADRGRFRDSDFFVAVGNNAFREKLCRRLAEEKYRLVSLVSPHAAVSPSAKIGTGTVIMNGAVVNAGATIGDGVIINTCASVDHDCVIGDYVHISVGAHLAGTVSVGGRTFVCCGAAVINNISICGDTIIGAGAAVVKNIAEPGTYLGVPARKKKTV